MGKTLPYNPTAPNRIAEFRNRLRPKMTQEVLADLVGASKGQIVKLERGERQLTQRWLQRLSKALKCRPGDLLPVVVGIDLLPSHPVRIVGDVQAGVFKEALEWPPEDQAEIEVPVPEGFNGGRVFGVRVVGPSMNQRFREGSIAVCVPLMDLGQDYLPEPGKFYVVYREDGHGRTEATIKRYQTDSDGQAWLWPMSDHPDYQQPWRVDGAADDEIRLWALVISKVEEV